MELLFCLSITEITHRIGCQGFQMKNDIPLCNFSNNTLSCFFNFILKYHIKSQLVFIFFNFSVSQEFTALETSTFNSKLATQCDTGKN